MSLEEHKPSIEAESEGTLLSGWIERSPAGVTTAVHERATYDLVFRHAAGQVECSRACIGASLTPQSNPMHPSPLVAAAIASAAVGAPPAIDDETVSSHGGRRAVMQGRSA